MERKVCSTVPNLPKRKVVQVAVSSDAKLTIQMLEAYGISCLLIEPWPALAYPVRSHADMLCHPLGQDRVLIARENKRLYSAFQENDYLPSFTKKALRSDYPGDILLNAVQIEKICFASPYCDEALRKIWKEKNVRFIPVRQGYAKCSTVVVSNEACITADPTIAAAAAMAGLDVLQIRAGFVELPGYSYGFLGGTCGKLAEDVLAFAGDLRTHPDYDLISSFLANHHVIPLCLHNGMLQDIGGILPLREEAENKN